MERALWKTLAAAALLSSLAAPAHGAEMVQTLGTVAQVSGVPVVDGQTFPSGTFTGSSDPAPFDTPNGADGSGPNFSASWTFNYAAPSTEITGASIAFGLYDGDSAATGDQVALFTLNDMDLTAALNAVLEAKPGGQSGEYFYTLNLPTTVFGALATGSSTFVLTLKGPGLGVLGETAYNGAILDYSTLRISSKDADPGGPSPIPEPSTWAMMVLGAGIAGVALRANRRTARRSRA